MKARLTIPAEMPCQGGAKDTGYSSLGMTEGGPFGPKIGDESSPEHSRERTTQGSLPGIPR